VSGDDDTVAPSVGSPDFYKAIVESAANPYVVIDADLVLRYASPSIELLLGWTPDDWIGQNVAALLSPDSLQLVIAGLEEIGFASRDPQWVGAPLRLFLTTSDGDSIPVDVYSRETERTGVQGTVVQLVRAGASQTMADAVDSILEGRDLDHALSLLTSLVEHDISGTAAILASGWDGTRFAQVAGRDRLLFLRVLDPVDRDAVATMLASGLRVADLFEDLGPDTRAGAVRRGFHACWCAPVPGEPGHDPTAALFIWREGPGPPGVIFRDAILRAVSLARLALRWMGQQQVLTWSASHDQLTGLTNREEFQNRLDASAGGSRAVLFCDLDDFKPVNENLGHRAGDRLLAAVAARMRRVCTECVIARVGGDEFAILLHPSPSLEAALEVAANVQQMLSDPISIDDARAQVGVTIGVAFDPTGRTGSDRLMDHADRLLRQGKAQGKNLVRSTTLPGG
jgi:diguanylate cyclase (GGDEF)-like protein/PAS domain S-box-containing protein